MPILIDRAKKSEFICVIRGHLSEYNHALAERADGEHFTTSVAKRNVHLIGDDVVDGQLQEFLAEVA